MSKYFVIAHVKGQTSILKEKGFHKFMETGKLHNREIVEFIILGFSSREEAAQYKAWRATSTASWYVTPKGVATLEAA